MTSLKDAKAVFKLDSPYTSPSWPQVSETDQKLFIQLLISFLSPIGRFRSTHRPPSKGKRAKKRKRHEADKLDGQEKLKQPSNDDLNTHLPSICDHITVGLNSTTRHLERLSSPVIPILSKDSIRGNTTTISETADTGVVHREHHLAIIFILQSCSNIARAHLPILVRTASAAHAALPPTILVPLSVSAQAKLAEALGQPRVGMLGVMEEAPSAHTLIASVRERVPPIEVPWLEEAIAGRYLDMKWHDEANTLQGPNV